ncbi:hypothetical protein DM01DRAFT_1332691 [Hesseltinella vesiculosa]|uniref:GDP/GTP exchange factor Sec2 N-terminal domain-containing protein n=1 Tax=Hesseltinella vesiculosa TaxID=101127 RepID=A0A1X2GSQ1_9FUNG|nr:hypothetical protein DM01DRAFT_1332691 [Hesseltinella vesiculosa]
MSPSSSTPGQHRNSMASFQSNGSTIITPPPTTARHDQKDDCACRHILVSIDSRQCALCDNVIPVLDDLLKERDTHEEDMKQIRRRLAEEQVRIHDQANDIRQLQSSVRDVEKQLGEKTAAFEALQSDMELLNEKYVDEIERVAEIQHSKDMVENELEDLSRRLFEEANGMVANEKREKYNLEVAQKHLENQLTETKERLIAEQMQLKELREKMEAMQLEEHHPSALSLDSAITGNDSEELLVDPEQRALHDMAHLVAPKRSSDPPLHGAVPSASTSTSSAPASASSVSSAGAHALLSGLASTTSTTNDLDAMLLDEFIAFIKLGTSMPLKKLHNTPFMKHCQLEDVDACLRFGPHSRLSARKINDAIVMNTCFIEEAPTGFADEQAKRPVDNPLKISAAKTLIWERFSSSNHQTTIFAGCQACGRSDASLPYRFRISYFDDWACIDRYCRDRLVAVCEFYVFIRNVRQGYYSSRSNIDLYQEATRLRLQMFYARVGALPWTLRTLGVKGDKLGSATSPKIEIPGPPLSESSPFPRSTNTSKIDSKRGTSLDEVNSAPPTPPIKEEPDMVAQPETNDHHDNEDLFMDASDDQPVSEQ